MEVSREEFDELKKDVSEILSYIRNDVNTGKKGMYTEVEDLKERVRDLEVLNKITSAKKAMLLFIGGVIASATTWIIKLVFNN